MQSLSLKKSLLVAGLSLAMAGLVRADEAATQFGRLSLPSGRAPEAGQVSLVAFLNGDDAMIHTENAYNSALGTGQGYFVQGTEGRWIVNFSNFPTARPGQVFDIEVTTNNGLRASHRGQVPAQLGETSESLALTQSPLPTTPSNVQTQRIPGGIAISWNAEAGLSYRVYRAELGSGANNGASRGIYTRVAQDIAGGQFVDSTANHLTGPVWYVVIATDKTGTFSAHSVEAAAPAVNHLMAPALKAPAPLQVQGNTLIAPVQKIDTRHHRPTVAHPAN